MTIIQILLATLIAFFIIAVVYHQTGYQKVKDCYQLWFTKEYWINYNIVEFASWFTKAIIIVPGLIFGIQIWWLFSLTLITSILLIWASNKKLLPTLVGFNTLWVWISCMVLVQHLL